MKNTVTGILAHVDAGKTTLSEAILYLTGTIRKLGRVDNRDAFLDNYQVERDRGITVFSKQAVFTLGDRQVTLLDTPGHVDFSAEMERTLQVLDYAIVVVSGADGVQGHTETLWRLLKRYQIPAFVFVNKMDQNGTDREKLMQELKEELDGNCIDFAKREMNPDAFYEELATCDEQTLEEYLASGEVADDTLCRLIAERKAFPCYFGSALKMQGIEELLDGIERYAPTPVYGDAFGAKVFKISRDEQGNRLTHLKVTGGALRVREMLCGKEEEKINQIRIYNGAKYEPVSEAVPGMICAVSGPATTYPGQGIGAEKESEQPILEPVLSYGVILPPGCDPQVMVKNLKQLEEEDPLLHIVWNESVHQIQAQVMGAVQIEILKGMIRDRFQVDVEFGAGHIVYKETLAEPVEGVGHFEPLRHYAEVHLWMEPAERGSGMQFETRCSEDILDRNWQRLVLTHLKERIHRGTLIGAEVTDVRITLITGRAHLKHTEGGDFRQATYRAVRQGLREAGCRLLEPYYHFRLDIPTENLGRAMTDLERRKASFEAPETAGDMSVLTGSGPVSTLWDYQTEVTAFTKGRGRLSCALQGYELCHNEEEVVLASGYDPDADLRNPTGSVFCAHGAGFVVPWDQVKDYMQVESPVSGKNGASESTEVPAGSGLTQGERRNGVPGSRSADGSGMRFGADEEELEAIFTRTYGERKNRLPSDRGPRQVVYSSGGGSHVPYIQDPVKSMGKPGYLKKEPGSQEDYLLVDGYNIIYAWEELNELAKVTLDGARHKLMDILCNYQGYHKMTLILVFDAYKVSGNIGQAMKYHNIHVIYTKEAETADQYIEKLAHEMGRKYRVTVATSDGLEQLIIHGQGCLLMSAKELREDIERTSRLISEDKEQLKKPGKNYIFSQIDQELAQYLEDIRLGKISVDEET
jgi:small GTP-binding protein